MISAAPSTLLMADDFTAIAQALRFDPEPHAYHVGMSQLPSVTQILRATGVSLDFERLVQDGKLTAWELEEARAIGTAVHMATHFYDEGTLEAGTVDPRAEQGLQNWIDWRELTGFVPVLLETPLHHPGLLVAGTVDRAGYFTKFDGWQRHDLAVVDLKWGDPENAGARWQTAAYAEFLSLALSPRSAWAASIAGFRLRPRYSVHLKGTRAKLNPYNEGLRDWSDFQQFITTFRRQIGRRKVDG